MSVECEFYTSSSFSSMFGMPFVIGNWRPVSGHSSAPSMTSTSISTWCRLFRNCSSPPDMWLSVSSAGSVFARPICDRKRAGEIEFCCCCNSFRPSTLPRTQAQSNERCSAMLTAVAPRMIVGHSRRGSMRAMNSGLNSVSTFSCRSICGIQTHHPKNAHVNRKRFNSIIACYRPIEDAKSLSRATTETGKWPNLIGLTCNFSG